MVIAWPVEAADETVHGAVVFMRTGDRIPDLHKEGTSQTLSALGAQQIYQMGQNFRGRYINGLGSIGLGQSQISTLSQDVLDNNQVFVMTRQEPYLIASAQAFMQGFYPPTNVSTGKVLANGTAIDLPFEGYQYPEIRVAGQYDPYSIYMAGSQQCPEAQRHSLEYYETQHSQDAFKSSMPLYNSLDPKWFQGVTNQSLINYYQAYEVYDYLYYQHTHNTTVFEQFNNDSVYRDIYTQLAQLANQEQYYRWGNTSASSHSSNLQSMPGKTLAALVLGQLQRIVAKQYDGTRNSNQEAYPVSFLFGDHEPFVSLFSLFGLDDVNEKFAAIPPYASSMIFELFSADSTTFPDDPANLFVRFQFQNGTDYKGDPQSYPIFGRSPNHADMPWPDFGQFMSSTMVNSMSEWCGACSSPALFCWGVDENSTVVMVDGRESKKWKVSPVVAGAIGAVVTLAVAALLFALAILVGGVRFHRERRRKNSELGGFKGSAKLASDMDLSVPKSPAGTAEGMVGLGRDMERKKPKSRVESWELRQKEGIGGSGGAGALDRGRDFGESRGGSLDEIESSMRPVVPTETV
ncbi:phosphoglycerate mutase-like protein [Delitschia confertaspora ATCC 74209]|uniref:Phosphoglycerate mutase-like protein n=1 Tax=Delitschia confertaspora ATCC 74209 TaxID=1513339 RepID=A0A9P4JG95_9PLEO|nr:phosphoglycerate mutase-like protein [Delitschia confertaspora ATCC 74209]